MGGEICHEKEALWVRLLWMVFNRWRYIPSFLQDLYLYCIETYVRMGVGHEIGSCRAAFFLNFVDSGLKDNVISGS